MNWKDINQIYDNEIHFFNEKINRLFFDIVTLETKLTKKKQQKLQQDEEDLDRLFKLIVLFLESVALINTYEYFKMKKILLTNEKQWNLDAESNRSLSRTRILPLDHQDLLQLKQFL